MARKPKLGRAGAALIAPQPPEPNDTSKGSGGIVSALNTPQVGGTQELPVSTIAPHPDNPREKLGDLDGLAASIANYGLVQPIVVIPRQVFADHHPDKDTNLPDTATHVVIAGHRRLAASQLNNAATIHAVIKSTMDRQDDHLAFLVENVQREDLGPVAEARAYSLLIDTGLSQRELAKKAGISQGQVSKRLQLLKLAPPVQTLIEDDALPVIEALELVDLSHEDQISIIEDSENRPGWSIPWLVEDLQRQRAEAKAKAQAEAELADMADVEALTERPRSSRYLFNSADIDAARSAGTLQGVATGQGIAYYDSAGTSSKADRADDDRERRAANKARAEACARVAQKRPTDKAALAYASLTILNSLEYGRSLKLAHAWIGNEIGPVTDSAYDWIDALSAGSSKDRTWAAWAICLANEENYTKAPHLIWGERHAAHIKHLTDATGYEPTAWERAQLATIEKENS